ncbi:MAG: Holliday junction branch migration protein RuvA [Lachnospiraceae bacterium]|nr:Holliday junction branch migration protein RuvA [Lachnospiraceae bacterium]
MYAYIKGIVTDISEEGIVVETNGIGYNIRVPSPFSYNIGEETKVYTYTQVQEDALKLIGFENKDMLTVFKLLISVTSVGPKAGLSILSIMSADDVRFAIFSQDAKAIAKAPGVGKKSADRIILDLKDKISLRDTTSMPTQLLAGDDTESLAGYDDVRKDAIEALHALGYGMSEAAKAVSKVEVTDETSADEVLKAALKFLF